jgi:predicted kinase
MVMLIVFGGLPATGKSSIARELVRETGAMWLRIDTIEQAIRESGVAAGSMDDAGYRAAYAIAEDNLRLDRNVIADSVNGWPMTRNAWRDVAMRAGAQIMEVEAICSDLKEHRRRVETRESEVPGLILPDWPAVIGRDYEPWDRDHLTIDTAARSIEDCLKLIRAAMSGRS